MYNLSSGSRSPSSWTCPGNLHRKAPRGHPNQMSEAPLATPFDTKEQQLCSDLPLDVWAFPGLFKVHKTHIWHGQTTPTDLKRTLKRCASQDITTKSHPNPALFSQAWYAWLPQWPGWDFPQVFRLYLLYKGRVGQVQELLKVLFTPLDNIPSQGQQFSSLTEHSLSQALLSLPESSNDFPEFILGQIKVLLYSLPELLPLPGYWFSDFQSCSLSSLPVLASCLTTLSTRPERPSSAWLLPWPPVSTKEFLHCHHNTQQSFSDHSSY